MRFAAIVEPAEPMKGLVVPDEVVEALGGGSRPPVVITINGHSWRSRIAHLRGRHLIGLSKANRLAAGVETGDNIVVDVTFDAEPRPAIEPHDLATALDATPAARVAFDTLTVSQRRELIRGIEAAKRPETRARRIDSVILKLTTS